MTKYDRKSIAQKGSMMVEALALLGLITMVTPVLYRKAAERTTELQDINVATQMRMISSAVDDFIKDNYNEIGETHNQEVFQLTDAEMESLENYLPYGFNMETSRLFDRFDVSIRKRTVVDKNDKEHHIYTTAVLAPLRENITMMRSSKIASMIGANGGVYRRVGDGDNYMLEGVQGAWSADPSDYDFSGDIKEGSLVAISNEAIGSVRGDVSSDEVLYRIDDGDVDKNTMQTTLYMDGHDLRGLADLIAQGGNGNTITIGSEDKGITNNLIVTGTSNLKGAVTAEGDVNVGGNLTVEGNTSLKNTTIEGDLIQSGGKIEFNPTDFTVNASGNINMDAGGNTTIGGTNVTIAGDETVKVNVGDKGLTINKDGNTISGDTTFNNGDVTIDYGDLIVDGGEIIVYPENPDDETGIEADWLYANVGVDVGGGDIILRKGSGATINNGVDVPTGDVNVDVGDVIVANGYLLVGDDTVEGANLVANGSTVRVNEDSFAVGGAVGTAGNKIDISDNRAFIGNSYATGGTHEGLLMTSASIVLRNSVGSNLEMTDNEITLENAGLSRVKLEKDSILIGVGTDGSEEAKIVADAGKVGFENKGEGENATGTSLYLEGGKMKFGIDGNTQVLVDKYGLALAAEGGNLSGDSINTSTDGSVDDESILNGSQVAISREGIIEIKAPTSSDNDGGFIRVRRLVSDVPYPSDAAFYGYNISGGTPSKAYDYYQVNPAYTSVMNDIKLASRGGARLSDILPDFINKGIYVVDNTYTNDSVGDWTTKTVSNGKVSEGVTECENTSCIASPWMGFVPAPQCPKNYAKVISMSPIRWRMSEVYSVYGADLWGTDSGGTYKSIVSGENFSKYFLRRTDPTQATFKLATAGGDSHTHMVESGTPLTFQTNTWLNTTVSGKYSGDNSNLANFQGWHAVMGFVYRPSQYKAVLDDLGVDSSTSEIYWNIFPVYASEMAAVANVYCYFDRKPLGATDWTWKDNTPVYQYDQLNNFRAGYSKAASGTADAWGSSSGKDTPSTDRGAAINDPTLGYDDVW